MEETTSAVAKVTSIELGRRWRLIYSGRAGEKNRLGRKREVAGLTLDQAALAGWAKTQSLRIRDVSAGKPAEDGDRQPSKNQLQSPLYPPTIPGAIKLQRKLGPGV